MSRNNGPIVVQGEDSIRTQYTPPEPSVKILKRPTRENKDNCSNSDSIGLLNGESKSSRQPVKTLQQRQLDYAEARLRILGEAKSPEDELDDKYVKTFQIQLSLIVFNFIKNFILG